MKHAGKARRAGLKILTLSLGLVLGIIILGSLLAGRLLPVLTISLGLIWLVFLVFTLSFFRDPEAVVPAEARSFVAPGHGTVDVIDEAFEEAFMGGRCRRISIFLSVFDVHVQNAPLSGKVAYLQHSPGKFVNAMRSDCGSYNENVLIGIESSEASGERVAVRLIAGLIARRIIPWVREGDALGKGQRIGLIQFGSRVDLFLPLSVQVQVKLGDKVIGGETIMALRG